MKRIFVLFLFSLVSFMGYSQAAQEVDDPDKTLIKTIYFGGGSYFVDFQQVEALQLFVTEIPNINQYEITIHSHTDNIGGERYNKWLSQMRSESVLYELILQSVPSDNIMIRDFGQNNPIFDNDSWVGKRNNRRVDIIFEKVVF